MPPIFPAATAAEAETPSTRTVPEVGGRSPSMASIAVNLPAPLGPSSATRSPRRMANVTWSSARTPEL